jgi:tRNA U34 5-methylaminomethyl-2-thiouridine-forming methyltransferase MnmC
MNPENPFQTELIETSDGTHTLKLKGVDEQYHSVKGALQESRHVFLRSGFQAVSHEIDPVKILEVGFGTGLNALVTAHEAINTKRKVYYEAVEPYPISPAIVVKLNYPKFFEEEWISDVFNDIHQADSVKHLNIRDYFYIRNRRDKIESAELPAIYFNLVYFDAFGPDTQPEMWNQEIFEHISNSMTSGGILVTYCSKGSVRRAMKAAGLEVEKLPGPPGKREIVRASKK